MISLQDHINSVNGVQSVDSQGSFASDNEQSSENVNLENIKIAEYFGMKEEVFDQDIMSRIDTLREFFGDVEGIKSIDFKLGNPQNVSKMDKLWTYMLLNKEEMGYQEKINDINRQKQRLYA